MSPTGGERDRPGSSHGPLGDFLTPAGYAAPGIAAVLREGRVVAETLGFLWRHGTQTGLSADLEAVDPVLLVPGFLAGDPTLAPMARALRHRGLRTYRSGITANIRCTTDASAALEARVESIVAWRGGRVQIVGHSLGGMLGRGLAVRRPDLVSSVVAMGSPLLAPGAHHVWLSWGVSLLNRLSRVGLPGLMGAECVAGPCARRRFEELQAPMPPQIRFTSIYSRRDGIIDWRACLDPAAQQIEVGSSHVGMAVDPAVFDQVLAALLTRPTAEVS